MAWKFIEEFGCWSTNFPKKWLVDLKFKNAYKNGNALLKLRDEIIEHVTTIETWIKNSPEIRKNETVNLTKLFKKLYQIESIQFHLEKMSMESKLKSPLEKVEALIHEYWKRYDQFCQEFDAELIEKRKCLWAYSKDETFKHALLELSPDFLKTLEDTFHLKTNCLKTKQFDSAMAQNSRHDSTMDLPKRNSQMRRTESSIFSYITRFSSKAAVCGTSGNTSRGIVVAKAPAEKVRQVSNRRKAFLSYRCAQLMADAWKKNLNIFRHFDIRAHPVVTVERPFLKVNGSFAHPNMPQIEKFKASNEVLDLLERGGWVSIEEISEKTALEIQHLMTLGLIWSRLDVPQGTLEPIQYWKNLLNNELSQDAIVDLLAKFEKHLENFESLDIATRRDALNAAEDLFFEITQTSSRKAPGGYYSDRFILFLDEFNGREFVFEKKTIESLFQDLNLALEFMAPEWLWLLLKSYLPIALKEQDLREGMGSYEENYEKILSLCEIYATGQIDANASLSENEIFKSWVQDIKALMVERNKIVASIPREPRECEFILDKTLVSKYRESIRQVMAKHFDFPLPLYSSCFIFQVCLDDHAQPMAVHDSSIFGNAMNLMILNHLSLNIAEQKKETLSAMRAMLNATKDERLIQPSVTPSQQTKYSPWILPDEELPFLSLTHKSNEGFKTISDVARKDSKNQWRWNIPGHLRLSRKSVIESEGFVPRVRFGSATIQRATWMLKVPSILKESSKPNKEHLFSLYLKALSFKKQYHLPTEIFMESGRDIKNIFIDFENFFSIELLFSMLKNVSHLKITEALPKIGDNAAHHGCDRILSFTSFLYFDPQYENKSTIKKD